MRKKSNSDNVIKYPKQSHFSIGFIIIGVMSIYMIYHLFTYITEENITIYEVTQGSISSNLEYNALAIREESVVYAQTNGGLIYLAENFGRVGVKSEVYAVDETGNILTNISDSSLSDVEIDDSALTELQSTISSFVLDYENNNFSKVYSFKGELESQVEQLYNISAMDSMSEDLSAAISSGTFHIYNSPEPGLVVYSIDGLEDVTIDTFTSDSLDSSKYSSTNLKSADSIISGQAVYKLITSDNWNLVCEIDQDLYNDLQDDTYIQIEFLEDETKTWTKMSFKEQAGKYYLILSLDDSMERFAASRYVHIKLINDNITGLKIPNSSIVNKEFFTIPKDYFYQGNNSTDSGVLVKTDDGQTNFLSPTIYYETDEYYYVDSELLNKGDIIIKPDQSLNYTVGAQTDSLEGVYNVNKGYAVFKQIKVLYQNEDYSIIETGTSYGISMYDHIVLNGDEVEENSIIN